MPPFPLVIGLIVGLAAFVAGRQGAYSIAPLSMAALAIALFTSVSASFWRDFRRYPLPWQPLMNRWGPGVAPALGVGLPFAVYQLGTGSPWTWTTLLWALVLFLLAGLPGFWRLWSPSRQAWSLILWGAALWVPFDERWLTPLWPFPEGHASYFLAALLMTNVIWLGLRAASPSEVPSFSFRLSRQDGRLILWNALALLMVVLPLGLGSGFLTFHPAWPDIPDTLVSAAYIALVIALPEELVFRGLLQKQLTRATGRPMLALVGASLLFGLSHYNNTALPDLRYIACATIAGLAYGRVFQTSTNLWGAILLHTCVDVLWSRFFPSLITQ